MKSKTKTKNKRKRAQEREIHKEGSRNREVRFQWELYRNIHAAEKVLDLLLLFTILSGIVLLVGEFFFTVGEGFYLLVAVSDVIFLGVIFLDMSRTFLKSRGFFDFIKYHWVDMVILSLVIVSLSSVLVAGFGRFSWLVREERVIARVERIAEAGFVGKTELSLLQRLLRLFK